MKNVSNVHAEKDKIYAPFLLAASFNNFIKYSGSHRESGVLYWYFFPKDRVFTLLDQFNTKTEPHIPAKDLFTAIETFWKQVNSGKSSATQR